jgi:hypothetical protein
VKTLTQSAIEFERGWSGPNWNEEWGAAFAHAPARTAFLAGAAAMAEQFAQGQGTVLQLLRDLAEIQTRNAQLLAQRLKELRMVHAEANNLSHWAEEP